MSLLQPWSAVGAVCRKAPSPQRLCGRCRRGSWLLSASARLDRHTGGQLLLAAAIKPPPSISLPGINALHVCQVIMCETPSRLISSVCMTSCDGSASACTALRHWSMAEDRGCCAEERRGKTLRKTERMQKHRRWRGSRNERRRHCRG